MKATDISMNESPYWGGRIPPYWGDSERIYRKLQNPLDAGERAYLIMGVHEQQYIAKILLDCFEKLSHADRMVLIHRANEMLIPTLLSDKRFDVIERGLLVSKVKSDAVAASVFLQCGEYDVLDKITDSRSIYFVLTSRRQLSPQQRQQLIDRITDVNWAAALWEMQYVEFKQFTHKQLCNAVSPFEIESCNCIDTVV